MDDHRDRLHGRFGHNRIPTVQVEIPAPLAEALEAYGDELIAALRGERQRQREAERQARAEAAQADKAAVEAWARQVWRYVRRHRQEGETERQAVRRLHPILEAVHPHPLGHTLRWTDTLYLVASHRRRVERWIRRRRAAKVAELRAAGWSRRQVADRLGVSLGTVDKLRSEASRGEAGNG